ncbi:ribosome biogenesis GTPase Der [Clostridium thermosuccinogenes]|uniref:GTPase Der n=1 Tax=Clostridium thermosuccinogenes TaxID=84032 RepID=A0A2K2F6M2_9CLOT|nr:ribosome biogenesis GTPase Der [Pseudoclostridium thermosuccinogenes]AUS98696.1 ribosome biogenesis GTPase Der [Pseudoclostridium thermosuccinogenes]PNT94433.1 ribosome biogenesis GTPase Der [Pseudoclostridium thermosuccinogenes]PNT99455.1 ribosome biogenesis GTPase Der [Pseudoclostridium thermosuccinogenes]PNU01142.1 ribosome biogenesis GTPase Der [Pseudoclostridium thermosuccinogenes]
MAKPVVAIVGRPNVGKSTFFNYVTGKRISIVEDTPGVTRDRIYAEAEWRDRKFTLIDTGGIEPYSEDIIMQQMKRQAEIAIETADVILFMVDVKDGLTAADKEVATLLRKTRKPVILAVNKVDRIGEPPPEVYEFYNLGIGDVMPISSIHGLGMGDLLDEIYKHFPEDKEEDYDEDVIKVAVVGKPNAGKSSLVNSILGENRVIVSDIPGTTRDAIDTYVEKGEDKFVFIDTAGLRKKSKIVENIERYSTIRSWSAIERADVCLIMIDAVDGVTEQDTKIAGYAHEQGKASIIVINKWDLIEKETGTLEEYRKVVYEKLGFMTYAPVIFISAKTGQRVHKLYDLIKYVAGQAAFRISTGMLNDLVNEAIAIVQPPSDKGRRLKIYYMTQAGVKPPTFIIFVNDAELLHYSYVRYLENQLRKSFGFEGTPIRFIHKEKGKE